MNIGYARSINIRSKFDLQIDASKKLTVNGFFQENNCTKIKRPLLQEAIDYARANDILVVWKLDRLGRSLKDLTNHR